MVITCHLEASQQKEGKESHLYLLSMFRGNQGERKKIEAVVFLAEEWQHSQFFQLLNKNCQNAIFELFLLFMKKKNPRAPGINLFNRNGSHSGLAGSTLR